MLTSPRIIAIDDEADHLAGLANSLNRHGVACFQIPFTEDLPGIKPCPEVQVIFADLHLGGGALASDHRTDFSTIGGLLEDSIKPSRSYHILLWTLYPDQALALHTFLAERLHGVTKPSGVLPLAKAKHLDAVGNIRDETALVREIVAITEELPGIAALFNPERHVATTVERELEEPSLAAPTSDRITERLTRLFQEEERSCDASAPPGFPARETSLEDWLDAELTDFDRTPQQMLNSGDEGVLFLLDRFVNAIATSRALSHPHIVREIVRQRLEALFLEAQDPGPLIGELPYTLRDDVHGNLFERWMDLPNPLFGSVSPRQFFDDEEVDAERILKISSLLDAIDDGAFS